jgi:hypothetical protein
MIDYIPLELAWGKNGAQQISELKSYSSNEKM